MELDKGLGRFLRSGCPISSFIFPDRRQIHRGGQTGSQRCALLGRRDRMLGVGKRKTTWGPSGERCDRRRSVSAMVFIHVGPSPPAAPAYERDQGLDQTWGRQA